MLKEDRFLIFILIGLLSILILLLTILHIDDAKSSKVIILEKAIQEMKKIDRKGFYYALGIDSHESLNPEKVGKEKISFYLDNQYSDNLEVFKYQKYNLVNSDILCTLTTTDHDQVKTIRSCQNALISGIEHIDHTLTQFELVRKRYKSLKNKKYIDYSGIGSFNEPIPNYRFIIVGHRLALLEALKKISNGNISEGNQLMSSEFDFLKSNLAMSSSITHKSIFLGMMDHQLNFILFLYQSGIVDSVGDHYQKPLTKQELSFAHAIYHEYAWHVAVLDETYFDIQMSYPIGIQDFFIKRHMSRNLIADYFLEGIEYSEKEILSKNQVKNDQTVSVLKQPNLTYWIRNPSGYKMIRKIGGLYGKINKSHSLNYKIHLFNIVSMLPHQFDYENSKIPQIKGKYKIDVNELYVTKEAMCAPKEMYGSESNSCIYF